MSEPRPLCVDRDAARDYLADQLLPHTAPKFSPFTDAEIQQLRERDFEPLTRRTSEYVAYHRWLLNAPVKHVANRSFGYQIKQKELERAWKMLFPPVLTIHLEGEVRALADADLVALVRAFGLGAETPGETVYETVSTSALSSTTTTPTGGG